MDKTCPICGAATRTYSDYMDGHLLLESGSECPTGHWSYEYSYGSTRVLVGDQEFGTWYGATREQHQKFLDDVLKAEENLKYTHMKSCPTGDDLGESP